MDQQGSHTATNPARGTSSRGNPLFLYGIPAVVVALALSALVSFQLTTIPILWSWLFSINLVTFLCFGIDKNRAKKQALRLPENLLYFLTLTGGGVGGLVGMKVFRHKRAKKSFLLIFWLILVFQGIAIGMVLYSQTTDSDTPLSNPSSHLVAPETRPLSRQG